MTLSNRLILIIAAIAQAMLALTFYFNDVGLAMVLSSRIGEAGMFVYLCLSIAFALKLLLKPSRYWFYSAPLLLAFVASVCYSISFDVWYFAPTYGMLWVIPLLAYYYPRGVSLHWGRAVVHLDLSRFVGFGMLLIWLGISVQPNARGLQIIYDFLSGFPDYAQLQRDFFLLGGALLSARNWGVVPSIVFLSPVTFYTLTVVMAVALGLYTTPAALVVPIALTFISLLTSKRGQDD